MEFTSSPPPFWHNGPSPGQLYNFPANNSTAGASQYGKQLTLNPMVTGTSVVGLVFDGGVAIVSDLLGSYGSMARFKNCSRMFEVNSSTVLAASGDYADYQFLRERIREKVIEDECINDGFHHTPQSLFSWCTRVLYNRRSRLNPLWNTLVIAGMQDEKPFLGYVDKLGVSYTGTTIATGYGMHLALPMLRPVVDSGKSISEQEAKQMLAKCMTVLYYRDCRASDKYELAIVTKDGVRIESGMQVESNWEIGHYVSGYN